MTEWWQYLLYAVVTGGIGYLFARLGANRERKSRESEGMRSAIRSIIIELKANRKLTDGQWDGKLVPFTTAVWDINKGCVFDLEHGIQEALIKTYMDIQWANHLCELNMRIGSEIGYYNDQYQERRMNIDENAQTTIQLLETFLSHQKTNYNRRMTFFKIKRDSREST